MKTKKDELLVWHVIIMVLVPTISFYLGTGNVWLSATLASLIGIYFINLK